MFSNYGKPEWFWLGVTTLILIGIFSFKVLPLLEYLPAFLGGVALWIVLGYLLVMIIHSTAGGTAPVNAEVPVGVTWVVFGVAAFLLAFAGYLHTSAT